MRKMYMKRSYLFTTLAMLSVMALNSGCPSGGGGGPRNEAPTANAGADQDVEGGDVVTLDGSATDPDAGDTLSFAWSPAAGTDVTLNGADTDSPTFTAPNEDAVLTFTLTVDDGNGGTDIDSVTVNVSVVSANQDPTADAGDDQTVDTGDTVTLDGSGSTDPDGDTLSFEWTQTAGTAVTLDGSETDGPSFTAPDAASALVFQLTVDDGNGGTDTDTVTINVNAANTAPTADAGDDQTVDGGDTVTLDGSGSADADGDTLTFAWAQTAGTAVTLTGDDTDSPTFTAPTDPGTLTFELTVDDGNGGTGTDTVDVIISAEPRLFIANFTGDGVLSYVNPSTVNGNIAPDTNLDGAATLLDDPADIVVNSAGQLLAANFTANSITTYDDAENANGNLAPDGNVTGGATQLVDPVTLAINTGEDLLFVADLNGAGASRILVFSGTTGATFNGNLAPTRTITSADLADPLGINFGANDDLYVANNSGGADNVLVFANASNLNGAVGATRILTSALFGTLFDVFVDPNDNLFVVDSADGEIYIFNDASSLNGPVTPDFTLDVTPAVTLTAIAVDSNDVGYIVDFAAGGTGAIFSYDNISTRNGAFNPNRTIQGAATQLAGPIRVFLTE